MEISGNLVKIPNRPDHHEIGDLVVDVYNDIITIEYVGRGRQQRQSAGRTSNSRDNYYSDPVQQQRGLLSVANDASRRSTNPIDDPDNMSLLHSGTILADRFLKRRQ